MGPSHASYTCYAWVHAASRWHVFESQAPSKDSLDGSDLQRIIVQEQTWDTCIFQSVVIKIAPSIQNNCLNQGGSRRICEWFIPSHLIHALHESHVALDMTCTPSAHQENLSSYNLIGGIYAYRMRVRIDRQRCGNGSVGLGVPRKVPIL